MLSLDELLAHLPEALKRQIAEEQAAREADAARKSAAAEAEYHQQQHELALAGQAAKPEAERLTAASKRTLAEFLAAWREEAAFRAGLGEADSGVAWSVPPALVAGLFGFSK